MALYVRLFLKRRAQTNVESIFFPSFLCLLSGSPFTVIDMCSSCIIMYKIFIEKMPFIAIRCVRAASRNCLACVNVKIWQKKWYKFTFCINNFGDVSTLKGKYSNLPFCNLRCRPRSHFPSSPWEKLLSGSFSSKTKLSLHGAKRFMLQTYEKPI